MQPGKDMARATKTAGNPRKGRRRAAAATKPRHAPQPEHASDTAIVNREARLTSELREALERQSATADVLQIIAGSPSDVHPVFDAVAERAMRLLDCWSVIVTRFDGQYVHFGAARGALPDTEHIARERYQSMRLETGSLLGRSLLERAVVQSADAQAEPDERLRDYARKRGLRAVLVVPLLRDNGAEGALVLTRAEPGLFAPREIELVKTFADQAVIAIQNARLFKETQEALQRQTATSEVLEVIGSSMADAQPVFERILDITQRLFGSEQLAIFLAPDDGQLHLAAHRGMSVKEIEAVFPIPIEKTAAPLVIGERQQRYFADVANGADVPESLRRAAKAMGNFSVVITPMLWGGRGIGMISVTREPKATFTVNELELLKTFANQAVIAIENARLFSEVQKHTEELSRSLEDLRTAQDRLVQTQKLASLGQLTAGIAHEIKNPLNFVNNFSALSAELTDELSEALKPVALDRKVRRNVDELTGMLKDNLEKVVHHGKRADSIVKNMLQHSREGIGEHRPADINAIVEEALNLAYHGARAEKAGFNITLQRDLDPAIGVADVYPQEIMRVLLNLISNGFYATTKRKVEAGDDFEPILFATTKNLGDKVEIRIRDNGTGIPEDVKEKIFNPFFTTKPAGEGTGLGLSISHDIIVKQHGGTVDVETKQGLFTEFRIILPRTRQR
jgi:signal transduction histidine kinase